MVQEGLVLFRIEHFQKRGSRIALVGRAHLVDLVQHDDRIGDAAILDRLDELAGHSADIGPPVTLDLRFVAHAAEAEAEEFAAQRLGDGTADRGLADPRRTDEQHDGTADLALVGADGQELDDPLLDVVEPLMVAVQDRARGWEVELVL